MSEQSTHAPTSEQEQVEYRDVPGFPGYRVGSDGSVWTCREIYHPGGARGSASRMGSTWKRLKPFHTPGGYLVVHFRRDGKAYYRSIHTVVLSAFVGPCPEGMECRHADGVRTNNLLGNLTWGTPAENAADRERHGATARGARNGNVKLDAGMVAELRRIRAAGGNVRTAALRFGIHPKHAYRVVRGEFWKTPTIGEDS